MSVSVVSALAGAIVGGLIAYFSAMCVYRRSTFSQAAAKFRSQFVEEIMLLEKGKFDVPLTLSDEAYTKHLKAKIEFEAYLSTGESKLFAEAWNQYFEYRSFFTGQTVAPGSIDVKKVESPKALGILKEVLLHARHK